MVAIPVTWMRGRWREELPASPLRWLAVPAWAAYRPLVALHGLAWDLGVRSPQRVPAPVISIGNLTAGGTGKTPAVALVCARLAGLGRRPAVASRGYRGNGTANDEAQLMGSVPVFCNARRILAAQAALAGGADCVVLDDGFQHRRLHRDLDLVLIDSLRPWGGGHGAVLPLGYLREGRRALRRASALWLTRTDLAEPAALAKLRAELAPLHLPILAGVHAPPRLVTLSGAPGPDPATLAGTAVVLASGLGHPAGFERLAQRQGWHITCSLRFPDHHAYTAADLGAVADLARDATVVITAKDAVKWQPLAVPFRRPLLVMHSGQDLPATDLAVLDELLRGALVRV